VRHRSGCRGAAGAARRWRSRENHALAAKFTRAVTKGAQFAASNEAETRDINQQFTNLNPALKDKVLLPRLGTAINLKEMNHTMEMMQKYGLLKTPVDLSKRIFTP
jgi:NitT/TauT family transport system substrate-binding protein